MLRDYNRVRKKGERVNSQTNWTRSLRRWGVSWGFEKMNQEKKKITELDRTGEKGFVLLLLSNWWSLWLGNILIPFIFEDNSDISTCVTNSRYLSHLWWLLQLLTHTFLISHFVNKILPNYPNLTVPSVSCWFPDGCSNLYQKDFRKEAISIALWKCVSHRFEYFKTNALWGEREDEYTTQGGEVICGM